MVLSDHSCLRALADSSDYDDPFNARHAEQVQRALSDIVTDMCVATGARSHEHLTPDNFNKRTVTKERLCQWLGAFSYMMNQYANPHLQMAVERLEQISDELLEEKKKAIELQSNVIELQSKVSRNVTRS